MTNQAIKNQVEFFLHNKTTGETIQFYDNMDGTMTLSYQMTLDPNEELNDDKMTLEEGRTAWKKYRKEGFKKATSWHTCKRDWSDNRD